MAWRQPWTSLITTAAAPMYISPPSAFGAAGAWPTCSPFPSSMPTALVATGIPEPSLAISSGRGLYLLWLHSPIPRSALPRWAACQREICRTLGHLGADSMAVDASRVLRVIGTRHGKANAIVEAITPAGEVWDFNELADRVLP
jgi:hypothetical protein